MAQIYTIQASDAPQHSGKLQEILQNLKSENRIDSFNTLGPDTDLSSLTDTFHEDDLILVVLTNQLEPKKEQIESTLQSVNARVAEIIVDHVVYDNAFITFPADLRPIRDREDMDEVWNGIEQSLSDMFPAKKEPEPVPPTDWPKYLKIAGIIIGVILVFFLIKGLLSDDNGGRVERVPVEVEEARPAEVEEARPSVLQGEDCLSFNPRNVSVEEEGNRFLLTDGRSRMMLFRTRRAANMALRIIRNYSFDNHCFAIRPNAGLRYFKVEGDIPSSGGIEGEDCIRINNPQNLTIRESSGTFFQILDGNSVPYSAKSREEAERIVEIVKHYKARFTCYVERPDPSMVYLRR